MQRITRLRLQAGIAAMAMGGVAALGAGAAQAQPESAGPSTVGPVFVGASVHDDISPPLRDMKPIHDEKRHSRRGRDNPVRPVPLPRPDASPTVAEEAQTMTPGVAVATKDKLSFAGVGDADYDFSPDAAPPDTNGAAGDTQYVQWVNESFAVFDKSTGALIMAPTTGSTLWQGFGGGCENNNDGDIIAQYDKDANRWVLGQFSVSTTPYLMCVAVSETSDATGAYHRYSFDYGPSDFPDYPKIGVWPDGYYTTYNVFGPHSFEGSRVCAFDRASMLKGKPATQQCVQLSSKYGGLLPSDLDGARQPPAGSPNYLLGLGTQKSILLWRYSVDWKKPAKTKLSGPVTIKVPQYTPACNGGTCIPQNDTKGKLDSLADRMMYRLAYRNFGDHEALVVNHSITTGGRSAVRWYEVRDPGGAATLYQSGTFAPGDVLWRWMGSIAMDKKGDIALGYSTSSPSDYPSIAYTGRQPADPLGQMAAEQVVLSGTGSQTGQLNRWGDYSAMSIDPTDDCTFYYTTEYLKETGSFNWSTHVNSFKFQGCK